MNRYRADLDGLRAIAISAIMLFHLFPYHARGLFLSVDVFFVLSGFLISGLLLRELEHTGRIDFEEFFRRRILRILPAFHLMILTSLGAGLLFLIPREFQALVQSIQAGLVFTANFFFSLRYDYFDHFSHRIHLLHTWSLSLEEQFYLIWPFGIWGLWRLRRKGFVFAILGLSILISAWIGSRMLLEESLAVQSYYSPVTRFAELFLGAGGAFLIFRTKWRDQVMPGEKVYPWLGFFLLAGVMAGLTWELSFPHPFSFVAGVGTVLLIISGRNLSSWPHRCLAWGPLVFIGKMSYGLYLWYWPVFAYFSSVSGRKDFEVGESILLLGLVFLLALGSKFLLEDPIRKFRIGFLHALTAFFVAPTLILFSLTVFARDLQWKWVGDRKETVVQETTFISSPEKTVPCYNRNLPLKECAILKEPAGGLRFLMMGDSTAAQFSFLWKGLFKEKQVQFFLRAKNGCPPLLVRSPPMDASLRITSGRECVEMLNLLFSEVDDFDVVVISSNWRLLMKGPDREKNVRELGKTLRLLREKKKPVILMGAFPRADQRLLDVLMQARYAIYSPWKIQDADAALKESLEWEEAESVNRRLEALAKGDPNFLFIGPTDLFSSSESQRLPWLSGRIAYYDRGHLNEKSVQEIAERRRKHLHSRLRERRFPGFF